MKTRRLVFAIVGLVALATLAAVFAWNRRNPPELRELLKKAERGDAVSQLELGKLYEKGTSRIPKNESAAFGWYLKSAQNGNMKAATHLGNMYSNGIGVGKDAKAAAQWLEKAANSGDPVAERILSRFYALGEGVPKNDQTAVQWMRRSAEQGDGKAQTGLGVFYAFGRGVAKDPVIAYTWMLLGRANGVKDLQEGELKKLVDRTENSLSESQRMEAQRYATEWWQARPVGSFRIPEHAQQPVAQKPRSGTVTRNTKPQTDFAKSMPSRRFLPLAPNSDCESGHWVDSVMSDGEIVKLEDGSVWRVSSADSIDSNLWLPTDDIVVCDGTLINTDDSEKVEATRIK